jgi:hypothetical protein
MDNHCEENVLFWVDAEDFRIEDRKPKVRATFARWFLLSWLLMCLLVL